MDEQIGSRLVRCSDNGISTKKTGKSTALSVRAIAAQVILQVLDQGKSLSTLLPDVQSQVKPQDLPLLQEITFGICRVLPRLENIIKNY